MGFGLEDGVGRPELFAPIRVNTLETIWRYSHQPPIAECNPPTGELVELSVTPDLCAGCAARRTNDSRIPSVLLSNKVAIFAERTQTVLK